MTSTPHWLTTLRPSDARGLAGIATQATLEVTDVAEGVHQAVLRTLGLPVDTAKRRTRGITGLVYRSINQVTRLAGVGVGSALAVADRVSQLAGHVPEHSPQRDAVIAALNGVLGDRLAASDNPLAARMEMRRAGHAIDWNSPESLEGMGGKVLLLIHGLCMNDHHWTSLATHGQPSHGAALAAERGYTAVTLRYNSGLPIAQNGLELAQQLETLLQQWPVPLENITLVGHSMGGLVARSALHQAQHKSWPDHVGNLVTLGTPHHGAPLERVGAGVDFLLGATPYTRPFQALARLRSAGIMDLRYGRVLDRAGSPGQIPEHVNVRAVAATRTRSMGGRQRLASDGLVPVASALGQHTNETFDLGLGEDAQCIVPDTHHVELLHSPAVTRQLLHWL